MGLIRVFFTHILSQTKALSYHDQLSVNHICGQAVIEMLTAFAHSVGPNVNYLPVPEYISFLFDLAGMSLNIQGILEWCLQILKELPSIENQLVERSSGLSRTYTTTLALYCVGVLRKYHKTLILSQPQDIMQVFEVLTKSIHGLFLKVQFCFLNHVLKWNDCQVEPI